MLTQNNKFRCDHCSKFMSEPYDSYTVFGCADPCAPEPYDPVELCKSCSDKKYKELLVRYSCCARSGDWQKSNAEIRAAKEAGLVWVGNSPTLVNTLTGAHVMNQYLREYEKRHHQEYLEYERERREKNLCKCRREKDEQGNCKQCNLSEYYCCCIFKKDYARF